MREARDTTQKGNVSVFVGNFEDITGVEEVMGKLVEPPKNSSAVGCKFFKMKESISGVEEVNVKA